METETTELREGWFERWLDETDFLVRFPHYAGVIARLDPIATRAVTTMAVALRRWDDPKGRIQLLVNRDFFRTKPEYRIGILLHEIQHISLGHLHNESLHHVGHPRLMEIAMELSANEFIADKPLPTGIHIPMFTHLGIAGGQSTMERYAILAEAYECGAIELVDRCVIAWSSSMLDVHRPSRCRGGSGLGDLLDARSDRATSRNWNRNREWGLGPPDSQDVLNRMKLAIQQHLGGEAGGDVVERIHVQNRVSKELERFIVQGEPEKGPSLDWRRVLHEVFPAKRVIHPNYLRPNRRFPLRIGEIPGRTRRPPKPELLIGIDTSASMNVDVLASVAHEVEELGRFAHVTIVECDAATHRVYPLAGGHLGPFVGGGDTDFTPVFEMGTRMANRFDGLLMFTDGRGEMPPTSKLPSRAVLWVITHEDPFLPPFGRVVRLPISS